MTAQNEAEHNPTIIDRYEAAMDGAPDPLTGKPARIKIQAYWIHVDVPGTGAKWIKLDPKFHKPMRVSFTGYDGEDFFSHRLDAGMLEWLSRKDQNPGLEWRISEGKTGTFVGAGSTLHEALNVTRSRLADRTADDLHALLDNLIAYNGISPRYSGNEPVLDPARMPKKEGK